MSDELCSRCQNFNIQAFERGGYAYRGYPIAAVIRSATAEESCSFCSMLLEHLKIADRGNKTSFLSIEIRKQSGEADPVPWFSFDRLHVLRRQLISMTYGPVWVHFSIQRADRLPSRGETALNIIKLRAFVSPTISKSPTLIGFGATTPAVQFNLAADPETPAYTSQDITGSLSSVTHNWSWSYLDHIQKWHKKCRENHPECNKTLSRCETFDVENAPLPSRCVEVSFAEPPTPNHESDSLSFVLRETKGQTGKYIILSHRWDESTERARTLLDNYACRTARCGHPARAACNFPPLSPLFLDAVHVALRLGVRYVWIDSLCIVQDDSADWDHEAVRMADYYQYAWLTIAATATSPSGGLFRALQARDLPRVTRLPYRDGETGARGGYFYAQAAGNTALAMEYWKNVGTSALLGRGWVYQEWMLSRRLLAFSGSSAGIFMQCQEALPQTVRGDVAKQEWVEAGETPKGLVDKAFKVSMKFGLASVAKILHSWEAAVEAYSGLQLTFVEQDRLVALAGVAKEFGTALQIRSSGNGPSYRYAAGLWTGYIRGLLWEQAESGVRVRVKGIPTWSWASMGTYHTNEEGKKVNSGVRVRWARYWKSTKLCTVKAVNMIRVTPREWRPQFDSAIIDPLPGSMYGNDSRFALLQLGGRLQPVIIDGHFDNADETGASALLTDHKPDFGRDMWRRVALVDAPEELVGWASIEHPDHQNRENNRINGPIYAFFVASTCKSDTGYGFGNWSNQHTVYQVLFLSSVVVPGHDNCYERLGTGRLFGNNVEAAFGKLKEDLIWLA
ncbi:HET-domain-containing protein [Daldinia caldariorum]|uniref:HET-domain-containing protein n=1 Tax=Daldinia caldariorum TaxID=326644 RepID=UPI002007A67F|nr:HET-domain-containing protein [Daldinia caldariorum]KAI1467801.1 HET-domain-containing protein [Daldinia caldariorum]